MAVEAALFGGEDGAEAVSRKSSVVIDDQIVVEIGLLNLLTGAGNTGVNNLSAVGPARFQTAPELGHGRRHNEDGNRLGHLFADLARPLNLDVQNHMEAFFQLLLHIGAGRAVGMVDITGMLQQFPCGSHLVKAFLRDEEVFSSVLFAGARCAGGDRSGEADVLPALDGLKDNGALSGTGRA